MIKIGIAGGRGYVGQELLQLLDRIDNYSVQFVGSNSLAGESVAEHTGSECKLVFQDLSGAAINSTEIDAWVIAQPNGQAGEFIDKLNDQNVKLIDVSSDYRFDDGWCYGLVESNQAQIAAANRIANPGCYATAAQLALLPIKELIAGPPTVFGVSGYSGAGKTPNPRNDQQRLKDNLLPYSLSGHTHELEVSRQLGFDVRFAPHVAAFFRGISVTVNVELDSHLSEAELLGRFEQFYSAFPLVACQTEIPEIREIAATNRAMIGGFSIDQRNSKRLALVCVIDNLRKGAASQIVQNLNCMFGLSPEHGLT